MARVNWMNDASETEITDVVSSGNRDYQQVSIGNCVVTFDRNAKRIHFTTNSDDSWSLDAAEKFKRILDYILVTYGR